MAASTTLTAEQRRERARKAGLASRSTERMIGALQDRELTEEQLEQLAAVVAAKR